MRFIKSFSLAALLVSLVLPVTAADRGSTVKTTFEVQGMHCDGCSATIVGTLERIDGVASATADHETGVAVAVYDSKKVKVEQLKAAIERLGYTVTAESTEPAEA